MQDRKAKLLVGIWWREKNNKLVEWKALSFFFKGEGEGEEAGETNLSLSAVKHKER